jgi:hypothetical protein
MKGAFGLVVVWIVLLTSCTNEPFELLPLGVTVFTNVKTNTTSQYTYKGGKLRAFTMTAASGTSSMRFVYQGDLLSSIVKDSTAAGYDLIRIHGYGSSKAIDSTFSITPSATTLKQIRKINYEIDGPSRVEIIMLDGSGAAPEVFELDWTSGNVTEIRTLLGNEGTQPVLHTLALTYDDKKGVFSSDIPYEYTLPAGELYLLSANNPVRFKKDTLNETKYTYSYNLKGYPSHIVTHTKQLLACSYAELR